MEYASCVWDPYLAKHIHSVEMVQHRAARFICSQYSRDDSVTAMLNELKLSTLQDRRKHSRLKMFYKINKDILPIAKPLSLQLKPTQRRNDNGCAYTHMSAKTDLFYNSYFPRTIRDWNELSSRTVTSDSISKFATNLCNN